MISIPSNYFLWDNSWVYLQGSSIFPLYEALRNPDRIEVVSTKTGAKRVFQFGVESNLGYYSGNIDNYDGNKLVIVFYKKSWSDYNKILHDLKSRNLGIIDWNALG